MDKSLDDIIKSQPKTGRRGSRRGSGAKAGIVGRTKAAAAAARAKLTGNAPATATISSDKILVSNLPFDVNEAQVRELFSSTVGPLKDCKLSFDANGKFTGTASVVFARGGDGTKAYSQYNGRLIDGKRPMKIEQVIKTAAPTLASRVAPAGGAAMEGVQNTAPRGGGTRRRGRGGKRGKSDRPAVNAEQLDADMEDYTKTETAAAT